MAQRHDVLDALKDESVLLKLLYDLGINAEREGDQFKTVCPFHEDSNPSLSIHPGDDKVDPGTFHCFVPSCDVKGSVFDLWHNLAGSVTLPVSYEKAQRKEFKAAVEAVAKHIGVVSDGSDIRARVDTAHAALSKSATPEVWTYLGRERYITGPVLRERKVGWDDASQRLTIPIVDDMGNAVGLRYYRLAPNRGDEDIHAYNYPKGLGNRRLNPESGKQDIIHVFAGEMDWLCALSMGANADTFTAGEGSRPSEDLTRDWEGKDVWIWYDQDEAGRKGADKLAACLKARGINVYVPDFSAMLKPGQKDFSDLVSNIHAPGGMGDPAAYMDEVMDKTPAWTPPPPSLPGGAPAELPDAEPIRLHLSDVADAALHNERTKVSTDVIVVAKDRDAYFAPCHVTYKCPPPNATGRNGPCDDCPFSSGTGSFEVKVNASHSDVVRMIGTTPGEQRTALREMVGLPHTCNKTLIDVVTEQNAEVVVVAPVIHPGEEENFEKDAVQMPVVLLGKGVQDNSTYRMTGYVGQQAGQTAALSAESAVPLDDMASPFTLDAETADDLARTFQPEPGQTVHEKFLEIAADLEANVHRIYGRPDLLIAFDLVAHSLSRGFTFRGEKPPRSWVEAVVVGDTRQGKSVQTDMTRKHYRIGHIVSGENMRRTGLLATVERSGVKGNDKWRVRWGIYVQCNMGLIVVDELQEFEPTEFQKLSSARTSGVAQVNMAARGETNARVRMFALANPADRRAMNTYTYGVAAIEGLITAKEDIARFDFAMVVRDGDVSEDLVYAPEHDVVEHRFTSERCHTLLRWVWSRPADAVVWASGADNRVLDVALRLARKYGAQSNIPLVVPTEQRIKIARLAIACAARMFSTDDSHENVVVRPEHVEFVGEFLDRIYSHPSMSYDEYARIYAADAKLSEALSREITEKLGRYKSAVDTGATIFPVLVSHFSRTERDFTSKSVREALGLDADELSSIIAVMVQHGLIAHSEGDRFRKTPRMVQWLRSPDAKALLEKVETEQPKRSTRERVRLNA